MRNRRALLAIALAGSLAVTGGVAAATIGATTAAADTNPVDPHSFSNATTFTVSTGGSSFQAAVPASSVSTFVIKDGTSPQAWTTAASGSSLLYTMTPMSVTGVGSSSATITVNTAATHQTIDGFGAAMTDSAASLIGGSSSKSAILSKLFGTGDGQAGLTIVRSPMGSSDLMASGNDIHTYEDTKGSFSVDAKASDQRQISLLQQAKAVAGSGFKILGTPWSAPGWAKKGGSLLPAQCGTDDNELDASKANDYATYFAGYVSAYAAYGIKPWMVSMQNEPENCKTGMPTTLLSSSDEASLAKALKTKLPSDVKVLGWDHNWNDPHYVSDLLSRASGKVDAIGYHCYDGTHYGAQTQQVPTLMTECSGFTDQSSNVAGNLGWEVANTIIGPLRNGSTGSLYWSLAQDGNGGPHLSSSDACQTCRGMITVNADGSYTPSQDFWFWAQFGRFVRPGSVRVDSNNSGDLSTVAFRNGTTTTLVVLSSSTHADGGSAGTSESDYRGHIVQYSGDTATQKTSWMVGADGYRRWIGDSSTYNCLKVDAGKPGPDSLEGATLDKYINLKDVWAVCGSSVMGTNSELEKGAYLKSSGGGRLTLGNDGKVVAKDSSGTTRWTSSGTGDRLILQKDGNLVLYSGTTATWATATDGKGGAWLSIRDDGSFIVSTTQNTTIWTSGLDASSYKGQIVQWDGDTASQKTSWQVGYDGKRRVIHDQSTFQCLHDAGWGDSQSVSSDTLDDLPDTTGVWAACGADRIGVKGSIEKGAYLKAGSYTLKMQADGNLVEYNGSTAVWATGTNGKGGVQTIVQADGNLVVYDKNGAAKWATGTNGHSAGWLVLGSDGSLRLYDASNNQVWSR